MVVAQSPDVATDVVHALGIPSAPALVFCEGLEAEVRDALGLATVSPRSLCVFGSKRVEGPVPTVDIQPLDSSFAGVVQKRAPHPPLVSEEELALMLDEGLFLGAFEGEKIVGFIGEDRFGAMDMLFVLPGHRRRGIGTALELAKVREQLAAGRIPWCHVPVSDKAALALQERLGLAVVPATEQSLVF
jgi:ribosomal protein S18 acetylase RimI-like enzyme